VPQVRDDPDPDASVRKARREVLPIDLSMGVWSLSRYAGRD
jgi:hypothetical protein